MQQIILHRPTSAFFSRNLLLPLLLRERLEFPEAGVSAIWVRPSAFQGAQGRGLRETDTSQGCTKEEER